MLLWKAADKDKPAAASDITNFGWEITQGGAVMPSISDQQVAPAQLLEIMSSGCSAEKAYNQMNCNCRVAGMSCTVNPMTIRHDNDYEDEDDCEDEKEQ